jgi:hypothetical protein
VGTKYIYNYCHYVKNEHIELGVETSWKLDTWKEEEMGGITF